MDGKNNNSSNDDGDHNKNLPQNYIILLWLILALNNQ